MQLAKRTEFALSRRAWLQAAAAGATASLFGGGRFAWADDPTTIGKQLRVHSQSPLNGEPELAQLAQSRITPLERFYVRNHGPIPKLSAADYRLSIEGLVHKPLTLSLDQLTDKFKKHAVEATLTCAGNRRSEMNTIKPVGGVQWNAGAIGNALWHGATLADLLRAAEIKDGAKHVWFEASDPITEKDGSVAPFGGSIPMEKALSFEGDLPGAIVAYEMNDKALSAEHGFPLRTVVPGFIGARSVKWLSKIVVSDRPSPNHYVADAYKIITSDDKAHVAAAEPIYPYAINAAICIPAGGAKLKAGKTALSGYALPTGESGCTIDKVEISLDGGKNWLAARLEDSMKAFTWRLWSLDVDLHAGVKELIVRAADNRNHTQPETTPWNLKGYLYNAWHRVKVEVAA